MFTLRPARIYQPGDIVCFSSVHFKSASTFVQGVQVISGIAKLPIAAAALPLSGVASLINERRTNLVNITIHTANIHHVGIVVKESRSGDMIHATSGGITSAQANEGDGPGRIFRCTVGHVARGAAEVASKWANRRATGVRNKYSFTTAALAALRPSFYGPLAMANANRYYQFRDTIGGPDGWVANNNDMFCAEFVIACYQAYLGAEHSFTYMAKDATNTLPATLASWLESSSVWGEPFR